MIWILILKAQGVPQSNNATFPKRPEEEETPLNRNNKIACSRKNSSLSSPIEVILKSAKAYI